MGNKRGKYSIMSHSRCRVISMSQPACKVDSLAYEVAVRPRPPRPLLSSRTPNLIALSVLVRICVAHSNADHTGMGYDGLNVRKYLHQTPVWPNVSKVCQVGKICHLHIPLNRSKWIIGTFGGVNRSWKVASSFPMRFIVDRYHVI